MDGSILERIQESSQDQSEAAAPRSATEQRIIRGCLIGLGILVVGTQIGVASSPYLVNNYPLVLIGISPLSRHIILVAPLVGVPLVFIVAGTRTLAFTALAYWLGRTLGETALTWIDQRSKGTSRFVRWLEQFFQRWSYLAVFFFPLGLMACIAGVSRMQPAGFFAAAIPGIAIRLGVYAWFGESLREPILTGLAYVRTYQIEATVLLVLGIGCYQLVKYRSRRSE